MRSPLELLDFNNSRAFIVPSAGQYPHLWLWDACFHAVILAYLRPELAGRELRAALHSQQPDGMLPHIVFNPEVDPTRYRPNPEDYGTGGPYSGLTQPPLVAPAARLVFARTGDRRLLQQLYPRIVRFHAWLKTVRDPLDTGLVAIVHPWESGMDNSPQFDAAKDHFLARHLPPNFEPPPRADTKTCPPLATSHRRLLPVLLGTGAWFSPARLEAKGYVAPVALPGRRGALQFNLGQSQP